MAWLIKALSLLMVLIFIQTACTYPSENTSNSNESSEEDFKQHPFATMKVFAFTFENLIPVGKNFAQKALKVSKTMLADAEFSGNEKPQVVQFRKNLTEYVVKYETTNGHVYTGDILNIYSNITHYYEIPEDKINPDEKFILNVLNKYNCKIVVDTFVKEFAAFRVEFIKKFEESKVHMGKFKQLLAWYDNFTTLTDFQQQFNAVSDFLKMAA